MSIQQPELYFPFDQGKGETANQQNWRSMARLWYPSGIVPYYNGMCACSYATTGGGTVTVQTGALWIDGFYAELLNTKTLNPVSGTGQVVVHMDPSQRTVDVRFVSGQTKPTQVVGGIWEIPLMQLTSGVAKDARQYSAVIGKPPTGTVIAETAINTRGINSGWNSAPWAGWWSWQLTKIRPDSIFDLFFLGSAFSTYGNGWVEYGVQVTSPNASSLVQLAHFWFNSANEHHTISGSCLSLGSELINANAIGVVKFTISVRCANVNVPYWHTDVNDWHTVRIVERMP